MKRVLVTGSNGFIGRYACEHLVRHGWAVRGAVRCPEDLNRLPVGVEPFLFAEPSSKAQWQDAMENVDSVVQLIGRAHVLRDRSSDSLAQYRTSNVEVLGHILHACASGHVKRLVQISSIAAVGQGGSETYFETTDCRPVDAYGATKLEAEKLLMTRSDEIHLELVILRAPMVYGPEAKGNFPRLLELIWRGIPLPLGLIRNLRSVLFVRNLADAIALALERPLPAGGLLNVADPEPLSTRDLVSQLAALMGRPSRLVPVPAFALRAMGRLVGRRNDVRRLIGSLVVSTEKIRREWNWDPPFSVRQGLAESAEWFRIKKSKEST